MSEEASKLPKDIAAAEGKVNVQINEVDTLTQATDCK